MKLSWLNIFAVFLISCHQSPKLNEVEALQAIQNYITKNPEINTVKILTGAINFENKAYEPFKIIYQNLAKEGYITFGKYKNKTEKPIELHTNGAQASFIDEPQKTLHWYQIALTKKGHTFVISKTKNIYMLQSSALSTENANIEELKVLDGDKYQVTLKLSYKKTPFTLLENLNENQLKRSYLLEKEVSGIWKVKSELVYKKK